VLKVNFLGLRDITEKLISKMSDGAAIVNLSSLAGHGWREAVEPVKALMDLTDFSKIEDLCTKYSIDDARSYFFSKEAVNIWTMTNRWTWRARGIRMNAICPGPVETPILQDFLDTLGERAAQDMDIMDRPGTPDDIAPVVAFLCSYASRWIRGVALPCDGGMQSHILDEMYHLA
jgi:NAD(P)-dependent dehydrogenase (short-subunit alcohol dehydrogenase family)